MDPYLAGKPKPSPTPAAATFHRRAHSDTMFDIDDIFLDDLFVSELSLDGEQTPPSLPTVPDNRSGSETSRSAQPIKAHGRSLSVDAGFFDGLVFDAAPAQAARPGRHARSSSMDGYNSATSSEVESGGGGSSKKAVASDRLAELALIDPKRAKRILANRQSAARSKERKIHYTTELERKVQTLQTEATNLSAQITSLQRDASGLTSENKELKLKLQAMEQQAHLRDALNEALGEELKWLRIAAGQQPQNRGSSSSSPSQFTLQPQYHPSYSTNQTTHNRQQIDPRLGGQPSFQDFSKRASS